MNRDQRSAWLRAVVRLATAATLAMAIGCGDEGEDGCTEEQIAASEARCQRCVDACGNCSDPLASCRSSCRPCDE